MTGRRSAYQRKRRFEETPEPAGRATNDVDPATARPGESFVIHQHHATRLHWDLRLEMLRGRTPVLVSWAVPKGLPRRRGERYLAIHVEDHPIEYAGFSGSIPQGNYGAGEVRIFDSGRYQMLEQEQGKLTIRLEGNRVKGVYHLVQTRAKDGKEQWLALLKEDERPEHDDPPSPEPMLASPAEKAFDDQEWAFEPKWDGLRAIAVCEEDTALISPDGGDMTAAYPELHRLHQQVVALDAMLDGEIISMDEGIPSPGLLRSRAEAEDPKQIERLADQMPVSYIAFDLLYLDGRDLTRVPFHQRRELLEETVVPASFLQLSPLVVGDGRALLQAVRAQGITGIVAKRRSSPYRPGKRSQWWLEVEAT
ncbi:MAG: DNA polymerase ligase N-terminal domain-containing protein [Acidimicrobiia bacterium]